MSAATADPVTRMLRVLAHPTRVRILRRMDELVRRHGRGKALRSPSELADELHEPLGNVSYHVRFLVEGGVLELAKTEPRRGAVEHYYRLAVSVEKFLAAVDALAEATNPHQKGET